MTNLNGNNTDQNMHDSRVSEYAQCVYDAIGVGHQMDAAPDQNFRAWYDRFTPPEVSVQEIGRWAECARNIRRAAQRPPTVGVFGESQSGKSYLISRFSGGDEALRICDPEPGAKGRPWDEEEDSSSIDFLRHLNPDTAGEESTSIICRFTQHPVDIPVTRDCFVGHALSHADIIISVASGYLFEFKQREDAHTIAEYSRSVLDEIQDGPHEDDEDWMASLSRAWDYLRIRHDHTARIRGLEEIGFQEFILRNLQRKRRPSGESWTKLVSMLWGDPGGEGMTRLYKKLVELLQRIKFAEVLEIPTRMIARPHPESRPLLDVELLNHLFDEEEDEHMPVYYRKEEDSSASSTELHRSEVSALLAELVLPVKGTGGKHDLLGESDVLDFPGARPSQSQYDESELAAEALTIAAVAAFRRGKLTRLFSTMVEKREISVLCLCTPAGKLDASDMIRSAVVDWLKVQWFYGEAPFVMAVTKADKLVEQGPADVSICQFGSLLDRVHRSYCEAGDELDWMSNWPTEKGQSNHSGIPFSQVFWVHNSAEHPFEKDMKHLELVHDLYMNNRLVQRHVDDRDAKWAALVAENDVENLTDRIVTLTKNSNKSDRLKVELDQLIVDVLATVGELHFVGADDQEAQAEARKQARIRAQKDVESIREACHTQRTNLLVRLLEWLSIDESLIIEILRRESRKRIQAGAAFVTCDELLELLENVWWSTLRNRLNGQSACTMLGLDMECVTSLRHHWSRFPSIPWVRERFHNAATGFFNPAMNRLAQQRAAAATIAAVWNVAIVDLNHEDEVRFPEDPRLPPTLTIEDHPHWKRNWMWMLDHWEKHTPEMYSESVAPKGTEPEWNESLTILLANLRHTQEEYRV